MDDAGFPQRLRRAVLDEDGDLLFLGNFEVERHWAEGEVGLPRLTAQGGAAVVNRMDEFALLLADGVSHVLLKAAPDPDYLEYLARLGFSLPTVHVAGQQDPQRSVTEDALADPNVVHALADLAREGVQMLPHGVSTVEEDLAARAGMPLAAPSSEVCKDVNSKVYSRALADELGIRQPVGWGCRSPERLAEIVDEAAALVQRGPVVVKEAWGVSGKGIAVVESVRRLHRLHRMIAERAEKLGRQPHFVIEQWLDKATDLNYQFTVARDGTVTFDFVKEAHTEGGVHRGHRFPARLPRTQLTELQDAAQAVGKRLAEDGYFGVVGVDALVDAAGTLFPILEINARNNMSTYQLPIQERLLEQGSVAVAKYYPLQLTRALGFSELHRALGPHLLRPGDRCGALVQNFATVNAGATSPASEPFAGRLYTLSFARSSADLAELDAAVRTRLASMSGVVE